ncbi:ribonuclease E activity regulator RraA [Psychrobacillus sp. FSL W7-1493]|uniref:ribonuclease E activity regulator RraA n=1 Tax=Psychrobacillus sp. FSL W7-1493 TaxID=2921552 RepID=UPI0030FB7662
MTFSTADLCDEYSDEIQVLGSEFKSYGKKTSFSGPICTVKVFEDNILINQALEDIPVGSVLVVDGGGSKKCALMGDRLAGIAENRNLSGIVINGCVRDSNELTELNIAILALGSNPLKSKKEGTGEVDIPLFFLGIDWHPGNYLYADEDGIVIAKRKLVD